MTREPPQSRPEPIRPAAAAPHRAARLKAALQANLARRKSQARLRRDGALPAPDAPAAGRLPDVASPGGPAAGAEGAAGPQDGAAPGGGGRV